MVRVRVRVRVWAGDALGTVVVGSLDALLVDCPVANLGVGHEDGLTVAQNLAHARRAVRGDDERLH